MLILFSSLILDEFHKVMLYNTTLGKTIIIYYQEDFLGNILMSLIQCHFSEKYVFERDSHGTSIYYSPSPPISVLQCMGDTYFCLVEQISHLETRSGNVRHPGPFHKGKSS